VWQSGKSLVWDVTVVCPFAHSYVASAARQAGSVAELATSKKMDKYTSLAADYHFQPIAVEMLGPIKMSRPLIMVALWNRETIYIFMLWFVMVALCNRAHHYIFMLFLLSSFFSSPNLSGRRLDVYQTLAHGVALVRI